MDFSLTIDGKDCRAESKESLLDVCRKNGVEIPTLCFLKGLTEVGACRLCLVEIEGSPKLFPACTTPAAPNQKIRTNTETLRHYRRLTLELFFSERNHVCAVCVANNNCELQTLAVKAGMEHVRFPFLYPNCKVDASHPDFVIDHNRCILCTRCVRVCDEVEGAHVWDVMSRGTAGRVISGFNEPWGASEDCTSCGKCVAVCPTGALWPKDASQGRMIKRPGRIMELVFKRRENP